MAIFHLHVKNVSRGDGRSAIAAAAYRAGETLINEAEERASAFGGRRDVVFTRIMLPIGAPAWMTDRAKLWNAVEAAERRKDARLAKEIEFAIPRELPRGDWTALVCAFAGSFVALGHAVDIAIHDDPEHKNPHAHLMLTTRTVGATGFGLKIRESDAKAFVHAVRRQWAAAANAALTAAGLTVAVDPRSHADRRLDKLPGQHRGPSRQERQAKRREIDMHGELERLTLSAPDEEFATRDHPVPDPDGRPIGVAELDAAEQAMMAEHAAANTIMPPDPAAQTSGERESAEAAVAEINAAHVSDEDAARYRLEAPIPPGEPGSRPGPSYWSTFERAAAEPSIRQGEPTYWRSIENRDRPSADDEPKR